MNKLYNFLGCGNNNNRIRPTAATTTKNNGSHHNGLYIDGSNDKVFTTSKAGIKGISTTSIRGDHGDDNNNDDDRSDGLISKRAQRVLNTPSVTIKYNQKVGADSFHPETNPQGYVDLGLAENKLCEELMTDKIRSLPDDTDSLDLRYYPDVKGLPSFRSSLKSFLEREFDPREPLDADNIVVTCGLTSLLDALAFSLGEEGDYIMTTSPYYYRIKNDLIERAGVNVLEVPLIARPVTRRVKPFTLDVDILEEAFLDAEKQGKRVTALLLVNPNNPLGDVYSAQQLVHVLDFAARYQLHVIVDEIYALSVFDPEVTFTSVLSLHHPDPERVHFLWGFSKDFGLSGYRCGILYTNNQPVVKYLVSLGLYQQTAPVVQRRLQHIIDDTEWLHQTYFPALHDRLRKHYVMFREALTKCGVEVLPCYGGIFVWMDASKYLPEQTFAAEEWLFEQFMKEKVFFLPGKACHSTVPGYYRIVFSLEESVCIEGIKRIQNVLRRVRPANVPNGF